MIAKVSPPSGNLARLVHYLLGPGRANEHRDPHLVAAAEHLSLPEDPHLTSPDALRAAITELEAPRTLLAPHVQGGYVWHCSLSLAPEERPLSDEQWGQIAREVAARLEFDHPVKAPCRWIAVRHGPSAGGSDHIHLAVNLIREDGTRASVFRDWVRLSRLCAELERRLGLQRVDGRPGAGMPGLTRAELERAARERREPDRVRLARMVRACAIAALDETEFVRRLRRAQVLVRPRADHSRHAAVAGYAVALPRGGDHPPIWYGGGRLAADLTLPRLRQGWLPPSARPRPAPAGQRAELARYGAHTWTQAAAVLSQVRTQLKQVPARDADGWAWAARYAAGVLSAWAYRFEPRAGVISRAANLLARSAQTRHGTPPSPHRAAARDLRGVARVVLHADADADGQRAVLGQLSLLLASIGQAHAERGQNRQARLVSAAAHRWLAAAQPAPSQTQAAVARIDRAPHRPGVGKPAAKGVRW